MNFTHFTAGADDNGRRLDRIIRRFLSDEQLSSIYKLLRKGLVKVDGKKCEVNLRVSAGSDIQIADFLLAGKNSSTENCGASAKSEKSRLPSGIIIFKNESILILNKPYDIPVQPSANSKGNSLAEIVQKDYEASHKKTSLSFRTGPLHRLDRKTTGLIAFSQNLSGAKWFSEKIKTHEIQKVYLALLEGNLSGNQVWEERIERKTESGKSKNENFHTVSVDSESGKVAHTEIFPVSHGLFLGKDVTLARVLIKTGRTHQIRAQAGFHGFPLLGDTAYGGTKIDSSCWGQEFFLHASELHFPHENPLGLSEKLTAPLPKAFEEIIANF